jgi:hypothetical protein
VSRDSEKTVPRTTEDEEVWSNEGGVVVSLTRLSMAACSELRFRTLPPRRGERAEEGEQVRSTERPGAARCP